ncbi:MAG: DUF6057 family protein [Bacteroidales bacterium]|nr:DUF6057 family protein [Bacteroidales bacterium]
MNLKKLIHYLPYSLLWVVVVSMGVMLLLQHTDLLFRAQEKSLFLPTEQFFNDSTAQPGGWLTYASAFLTQFFYYPILGVVMLVALWSITVYLLAEGMKIERKLMGLLIFVPVSLYSVISQIGYSLFYIKLQGFLVVPTLALFVISVLLYISSILRGYWQSAFIALVALVAYPLMGAYGILAPLVMAVWSGGNKVINILIAIAATFVACMIFYYTHVTVMMSQMVYAALPSLYMAKGWQAIYMIPYLGIVIGLFLPLVSRVAVKDRVKMYFVSAVTLLSIGEVVGCNYNNNNFRRELKITKAMESGDWMRVLEVVDDNNKLYNPTRQIVFARNMALWRIGKLGDYAFSYMNETQKSKAPYDLSLPQICASQQYYYAGMPYLAYRWTMETSVSIGWSVENLKSFVKCAITMGDYRLALRYLDVLSQTKFHKDWADYYYSLAKNPTLIKEDTEIMWVRSLMRYRNSLEVENGNTSDNIFDYYARCDANDSNIQEFGMISAMIKRDHKLFFERLIQYVTLNSELVDMPKHYQEAALLMATLDGDEKMLNLPYSYEVKRTFEQFKKAYQSTEHLSSDEQAAILWQRFGRTYFYYYTLNRGII